MALNVPPPFPFIFSTVCFVYLFVYVCVCFIKQTTCFYMLNGQLPPPGTAPPPPVMFPLAVQCTMLFQGKNKNTPNWPLQLACVLLSSFCLLPSLSAIINVIFMTCHAHSETPAAHVAAIFQLSLRHCDVFN